jgi:hypothetical protein
MSLGISREERLHVEGCPLAHIENYLASCACGMTDSREERVAPVTREAFRKHFIHWKNTDWVEITRKILAAADALELSPDVSRESEWQPSETAPREGVFLVFGTWDDDCDDYYRGKAWWQFGHGHANGPYGEWDSGQEPTHWRPLPDPPKATTEGEE